MTVPLLNKGGELLFDQVHEANLQAFAVMVELNARVPCVTAGAHKRREAAAYELLVTEI